MEPQIQIAVAELRDRLSKLYGERFQRTIVFGSRARGEGREDSDIDMVLVGKAFTTIKAPNRFGTVLQAIRSEGGVDVLCFTPEEFAKYRRWPGIVKAACEEGIWL